jgi:predicted DNA-binding transcriptional regulator AlpA
MNSYVTKREIAEKFCVTTRTVDDWVARGRLAPPIKFGSTVQARVRWPAAAVAKLEADLRGAAA